jgi:MATE family multidrug resistance protein
MCIVAAVYLIFPQTLVALFEGDENPEAYAAIAAMVPTLLTCVALYSLADSVNVTFAFALRGAGDTWFVSLLTFTLGWPIMILPTFVVVLAGANLYWAWGFATAYVCAMAVCFWLRFRSGRWKSMRVIEAVDPAVTDEDLTESENAETVTAAAVQTG